MVKEAEKVIVGQAELPPVTKEECVGLLKARTGKVLSGKKGEVVVVDDLIGIGSSIVSLPDGWKQLSCDAIREAFPEFANQMGVDLKSNPPLEVGKQWYIQEDYLSETRRYATARSGVELVRTDLFRGKELWRQEWKLVNRNFVPPKRNLGQRFVENVRWYLGVVQED